jgi:hypothetical protein
MNRRGFLSGLCALPFVGALFKRDKPWFITEARTVATPIEEARLANAAWRNIRIRPQFVADSHTNSFTLHDMQPGVDYHIIYHTDGSVLVSYDATHAGKVDLQ